jgi:hypothetical protein
MINKSSLSHISSRSSVSSSHSSESGSDDEGPRPPRDEAPESLRFKKHSQNHPDIDGSEFRLLQRRIKKNKSKNSKKSK